MADAPFDLKIFAPGRADVFVDCADAQMLRPVVERLDAAGLLAVGALADAPPDPARRRTLADGCAGIVTTSQGDGAPGLPALRLSSGATPDVDGFLTAVLADTSHIRPYAFMVGRLERDFRHAREAMRVAVEREAGIPCLWVDDGRHQTSVDSVSERTRLLIRHATFVIADLTLGVESPERENPSRAHEVGMAIAYGRPLMLSSQEPRRYPYFSICDMQMTFWRSEDELEHEVTSWIRLNRGAVARRVFNYELPAPRLGTPTFSYDPKLRFVGPNARMFSGVRRLLARLT